MLILLVCSGNTCRSPLAAAMLAAKVSGWPGDLDITIADAGTGALPGAPVSEGSYLVGLELGLDLSAHRAQRVTPELLAQADLILAMGENHAERLRVLGGGAKVQTLSRFVEEERPRDIPDPWGGDITAYRAVAALLDPLLDRVVARVTQREQS